MAIIDYDDRLATAEISELIRRMADRRPFYAAVGEAAVQQTQDNFRRQGSSAGPWQRLKAATIRRRTAAGQTPITILRSNAKAKQTSLAGSISYRADASAVEWGTPLPYGRAHQLGADIQMPARTGRIYRSAAAGRLFARREGADREIEVQIPGYTIHLPARPFIEPPDEEEIGDLAADWLGLE
ncbi:MAG: virion morphogenesis protein [Tistrella sp.]|uniref:Phage virion morphogenesis protein n=1 Tax=Tistrella mobilis TaxID=171437 RepID=A0A3B9IIK2_9PROT|nr:phage virion morphogenesis protein [Tistrella sp.]MAD39566.1 virion morphogenesis protein [Tistrella sp.]MBA74911.1 virion morphogenesis protein [Tistrella sp.]HAE47580.1 phage virion morphogenesis protein [Tistrella mobilis]